MENTISIIGTAGRSKPMTVELYRKMVKKAKEIVEELDLSSVHLVSGGAAWSDHVAVELFLSGEYDGLTLHMPCKWIGKEHYDNGSYSWQTNPGKLANSCHRKFSYAIRRNTMEDIEQAVKKGATIVDTYKGFHHRNSAVARSQYLIAFTWSKERPTDGGTLDTWNKCKGKKIHVCLEEL